MMLTAVSVFYSLFFSSSFPRAGSNDVEINVFIMKAHLHAVYQSNIYMLAISGALLIL